MKLHSGKRLGQSRQELTASVIFSLFIHVTLLLTALFLYTYTAMPRKFVPLFYDVKLVAAPAELLPAQPVTTQTAPSKQPEKAIPKKKVQQQMRKPPAGHLPELKTMKPKSQIEQTDPLERMAEEKALSADVSRASADMKEKAVGEVKTRDQEDFKYPWYLAAVREKIRNNWNPPPDVAAAKARVVFSISRSGWVDKVDLDSESSSGSFGFKQAAIRAIRSSHPFPAFPDGVMKQSLELSIDLMAE